MRRTDDELLEIAEGIFFGKVIADWQIEKEEDVSLVFQVINYMTNEQLESLRKQDIGLLFEYKEEAVGWNGDTPTFLSMNYVSVDEAKKIYNYLQKKIGE